jgi:general secretion pathway protein F
MSAYFYRALTSEGTHADGQIEAQSERHAMTLLLQKRLSVFEIKSVSEGRAAASPIRSVLSSNPGISWRAGFYRQLAMLIGAGVPLDRALDSLQRRSGKDWESKLYAALVKGISEGKPLSAVLRSTSDRFAGFESGILAVGETTGSIKPVLLDLATTMERQAEMRSKITSALVYPAFLMALAPISLILISSILVPNIAPLFDATSAPMPFMLRAMVAAHGMISSSPVMVGLSCTLLLLLVFWIVRKPATRNLVQAQLSKLPFIGLIAKTTESSRICRLLATLLENGAPLQTALATLEETTSKSHVKAALRRVQAAVSSGRKLSSAFADESILVKGTPELVAVGEETNQLATMLSHAALSQEQDSLASIDRLMTLLVPLLTVLMGLMVGGIMLSVMQAILSINQLATQ